MEGRSSQVSCTKLIKMVTKAANPAEVAIPITLCLKFP